MNTKLLFVALSGFLFVAGFGGALWLGDRQNSSQGNDAAVLYAQEIKALGSRMTTLEQQLDDQSRVLAAIQQGLAASASSQPANVDSPSALSVKEVAEAVKREVVHSGGPPLVQGNGEPTEALEHSVRAVMERVRKEEKDAEVERDKAQREKRVKDRVERMTPELGLDAYQATQLTAALLEADDKLAALRGNGRQGGGFGPNMFDPGATNPLMEIMNQRDEKLRLFLSSSQMEKFDQLEPGRRFMRNNNNPNTNQDGTRQRGRNRGDNQPNQNNNNGGGGGN